MNKSKNKNTNLINNVQMNLNLIDEISQNMILLSNNLNNKMKNEKTQLSEIEKNNKYALNLLSAYNTSQ